MTNEEWKKAFKEGFAEGYAAAKKEMNYQNLSYQNFPPVYYGGASPKPDSRTAVMGTPTGGLSYAVNKPGPDHKIDPFVSGMTAEYTGYNGC